MMPCGDAAVRRSLLCISAALTVTIFCSAPCFSITKHHDQSAPLKALAIESSDTA